MFGRKSRTLAVAVPLTLGASAIAFAALDHPPRVDRAAATITFTHVEAQTRGCEGPEGAHLEQRVTVTGRSEGDPRLSGEVRMRVRTLLEEATGDGFERGTLRVRDPQTGATKLHARFDNADIDEISQGTLVGHVRVPETEDAARAGDAGGASRSALVANWRITFQENGAVTAQIGGVAPDGRLPATIVRGACSGPFETSESDLPAPTSAAPVAPRSMHVGPRYVP
jgi:hypothetical protein